MQVGGTSEVVDVKSEQVQVQTYSAERSADFATSQVQNLPISNRSFTALTALSPGVSGGNRLGGGGFNNIMMEGISAVDTGNGGILLQMNVGSIAEVKVLVSNYQAEANSCEFTCSHATFFRNVWLLDGPAAHLEDAIQYLIYQITKEGKGRTHLCYIVL